MNVVHLCPQGSDIVMAFQTAAKYVGHFHVTTNDVGPGMRRQGAVSTDQVATTDGGREHSTRQG